ncbi:hypothetical protein [Roseibium aggregatum]|uniref:Uncharacterized protein n=1 Tax=Roseibium aggregatum TaxID=187304 RepID=A0A926P6U0_9HYPH|nr:hypothetical protein [Roseibium aggregatum]MBD1549677.1 hypothetical protein [Roseibium aggregatum]
MKWAKVIARAERRDVLDEFHEMPREMGSDERRMAPGPIPATRSEGQQRVNKRHVHPPKPWWSMTADGLATY